MRDIPQDGVLAVMCLRNERPRLPFLLDYYRALGVVRFLVIDNDSTDGTGDFLTEQADVCLWHSKASYRAARFGLDWTNYLLMRHGHGRWCLVVDADELLVYPHHDTCSLSALTKWLDGRGQLAFGALMLELYPKGVLGDGDVSADPLRDLTHFDAGPYRAIRQQPLGNLWVQGGVRERVFFPDLPRNSPTLNKLPLIKWNRRWAFVNSTHSILPRRLNWAYDGPGGEVPSGVLLHTKFQPQVIEKAQEDLTRRQHFHDPDKFRTYYSAVSQQPNLWHDGSVAYSGWPQLVELGLMAKGYFGTVPDG